MSDRADKAKSTGDGREAAAALARALYRRGVLMVLLSAVVLSLNGLVLRSIDDATAWQVIFYRSVSLSVAMFGLFLLRHRRRAWYELRRAGRSALAAGPIMGVASVCFIISLSNTTVANTLFTLSSVPLFAAALAWLVLGERVARRTWVAMAAAMAGIAVMVADGIGTGSLFGNVMALATSVLFAWFVVALRRGRNVDMTLAVCVGGAVSTTREADAQNFVRKCIEHFGHVDILINCAGSSPGGTIDQITEADWMESLNLKFMGYVRCTTAVVSHMRERKYGRIVSVIGNDGIKPIHFELTPGAANAAGINFTLAMSESLALDNVLINAVNPGPVDTDRWWGIFRVLLAGVRRSSATVASLTA